MIQTASQNHKGGTDVSSSKLDFVGRVTDTKLTTINNLSIETHLSYDRGSRIKATCQTINNGKPEPIARMGYNGIGELTTKTLGCKLQTLDYTYDMHGWLKTMNDPTAIVANKDLYGMALAYDQLGNITNWNYANAHPPLSGGQTGLAWGASLYQYDFTYDNLNRLKISNLAKAGTAVFSNQQNYDDNGNVTNLKRTLNGAVVDNMSYNYQNSNRLNAITDTGTNPALGEFFKDGTANYTYDANGNLSSDTGKGISNVSYNYLNLTTQIIQNGQTSTYTYTADGKKLSANFGVGGVPPSKKYDYLAIGVYKNDTLEFIPTAEGRYINKKYEYILKDHLGNARISCGCKEGSPVVIQENHYDPWGMSLPIGIDGDQRFTYNSKEKQEGTGWLDYGARMYDPQRVVWNGVDIHAEKYESISTFSYCFNNPLRFIDIRGKDPGDIIILFAGANLNPLDKDPYGITTQIKNNLLDNINGGKVEKFLSNYMNVFATGNTLAPVGYEQDLDNLTQEAYDYIKNNLEKNGKIAIYGYSWGGVLATYLTKKLENENIDVSNLILIDAARGPLSDKVDRSIPDIDTFVNVYQETKSAIRSRGYPATKESSKTEGINVKVSYVRDKNGKFVKASHSNIDDATLEDVVNNLINFLNTQPDEKTKE